MFSTSMLISKRLLDFQQSEIIYQELKLRLVLQNIVLVCKILMVVLNMVRLVKKERKGNRLNNRSLRKNKRGFNNGHNLNNMDLLSFDQFNVKCQLQSILTLSQLRLINNFSDNYHLIRLLGIEDIGYMDKVVKEKQEQSFNIANNQVLIYFKRTV